MVAPILSPSPKWWIDLQVDISHEVSIPTNAHDFGVLIHRRMIHMDIGVHPPIPLAQNNCPLW